MWLNPQEFADLVTFTEEIYNEKLSFCVVNAYICFITKAKFGNDP